MIPPPDRTFLTEVEIHHAEELERCKRTFEHARSVVVPYSLDLDDTRTLRGLARFPGDHGAEVAAGRCVAVDYNGNSVVLLCDFQVAFSALVAWRRYADAPRPYFHTS